MVLTGRLVMRTVALCNSCCKNLELVQARDTRYCVRQEMMSYRNTGFVIDSFAMRLFLVCELAMMARIQLLANYNHLFYTRSRPPLSGDSHGPRPLPTCLVW